MRRAADEPIDAEGGATHVLAALGTIEPVLASVGSSDKELKQAVAKATRLVACAATRVDD